MRKRTVLNFQNVSIKFADVPKIEINADRLKIAQVLNNLVGNAVKYSNNGTNVLITFEMSNEKIRVIVKDEGMGIKPENLQKLFERYYRVEQESKIAGFGIGLYLSTEIIEAHGGKIWAESEYGRGSTFYFELPAVVAD